ncbi:hypothetical protein ACIGNX_18620 [Actinosynnema sp. NPDC053489]|uniref:hypothetical protein n=1 Tax=Actinosynnema sp. NPDC053489 TaxID=3363916 RepID=UPI0037CCA1B0
MGFMSDIAIRAEFRKRKRRALMEFYEAKAQLNFLESPHAKGIATADGIREQRDVVERLQHVLKVQFDTVVQ